MNSILTYFLVALLFFILGAAVVGLAWYFQAVTKRGGVKAEKASESIEDQTEIARLIRDNKTQELVVEMDGNSYKNFHELTPVLQRRLNFTSNVLAKWLAAPAPQPSPEEGAGSEPAEPVPSDQQSEVDEAAGSGMPADWVPPFSTDIASEVKPVSTELPDMVDSMLNPPPQSASQFKSIAMQINDVLQTQLAGTALESRGISVNDAPDRGVIFTLDGKQYPGLKEIPDEEVRRAIRAAVLEWETRK